MAYKISYKVVSEQGEQMKKTAKDMDNYISQMNKIISNLGNDELLESVRADLKKFNKQLEDEKTFFNLAGQILIDVVQSYTGAEKKTVQKVDKTKAHNRDFYKRPVTVASAGGGSSAAASAGASTVNVSSSAASSTVYQEVNTTNVYVSGAETMASGAEVASSGVIEQTATASNAGAGAAALGAGAILTAGGILAGTAFMDYKDKKAENEE